MARGSPITIDKKSLNMTGVLMTDSTPSSADTPGITIVTEDTYSEFNEPVDLEPPPDALNAPFLDE